MAPGVVAVCPAVVQVRPRGAETGGEGGRRWRKQSCRLSMVGKRSSGGGGIVWPSQGGVGGRGQTRLTDGLEGGV